MGSIPKQAGASISKKHAKTLVENFTTKFSLKNKSIYYSWDVFERLKKLPGCVGIRVYAGLENDVFTPVLIAVDEKGDNIYYDNTKMSALSEDDDAGSGIEERGGACPPYCPSNDL
jgi:hypothetical protein